jgi:hypothetical protein
MISNKKIFPWIVALILVFGGLIYYTVREESYTAKINLVVTPASSKITLNGKSHGQGTIRVKPGNYKIVVSKAGFSSDTYSTTVKKGAISQVGIVLISNSISTAGWYFTHPTDEQVAEGISSRENTAAAQEAVDAVPLIKLLPFTGPGFEYQINYGSKPGSDSAIPIIYITAQSPQAQQDALAWIRTVGYDPSKMTIQYINALP